MFGNVASLSSTQARKLRGRSWWVFLTTHALRKVGSVVKAGDDRICTALSDLGAIRHGSGLCGHLHV